MLEYQQPAKRRKPGRPISADERTRVEQRRRTVAANLASGLKASEIAEALDVSVTTIRKDAERIFARWKEEQIDKLDRVKTMQHHRLMRALNAIWSRVTSGDMAAIDRFLKILDMEAKLLGTFAPQKFAPTTPDGLQPYQPLGEIERMSRIEALLDVARQRALAQQRVTVEVLPQPVPVADDAELVPLPAAFDERGNGTDGTS
jgi:DNA-binding CsgD family transcriptional regulator